MHSIIGYEFTYMYLYVYIMHLHIEIMFGVPYVNIMGPVGPYVFQIPANSGGMGQRVARSWSYFLQRNIPLTRGLDQRIRLCGVKIYKVNPPEPPIEYPPEELHLLFPEYDESVENHLFFFKFANL